MRIEVGDSINDSELGDLHVVSINSENELLVQNYSGLTIKYNIKDRKKDGYYKGLIFNFNFGEFEEFFPNLYKACFEAINKFHLRVSGANVADALIGTFLYSKKDEQDFLVKRDRRIFLHIRVIRCVFALFRTGLYEEYLAGNPSLHNIIKDYAKAIRKRFIESKNKTEEYSVEKFQEIFMECVSTYIDVTLNYFNGIYTIPKYPQLSLCNKCNVNNTEDLALMSLMVFTEDFMDAQKHPSSLYVCRAQKSSQYNYPSQSAADKINMVFVFLFQDLFKK